MAINGDENMRRFDFVVENCIFGNSVDSFNTFFFFYSISSNCHCEMLSALRVACLY